jgi:hypothetical protein
VNTQRTRQPTEAQRRRQQLLEDLADAVTELTHQARTTALLVRDKGQGQDGKVRGAPTSEVHRTAEPGLLVQLQRAAGRRHAVHRPDLGYGRGLGYGVDAGWLLATEAQTAVRYDREGGRTKPGSRPPTNLAAVDLLADIAAGVRSWAQRLGSTPRGPVLRGLRSLQLAAQNAPNHEVRELVRDMQSWARSAKVALSYEAPIVDLGEVYCPECGGVLRVHDDASSDVWCAGGPWPRCVLPSRREVAWTPGCGATWPRGQWLMLLEAADADDPADADDGADGEGAGEGEGASM